MIIIKILLKDFIYIIKGNLLIIIYLLIQKEN